MTPRYPKSEWAAKTIITTERGECRLGSASGGSRPELIDVEWAKSRKLLPVFFSPN
jgi:hypothetical protein